jgi:hypothetical protein
MILAKYLNLNKPGIEKSVVGLTKDQFLKLSDFLIKRTMKFKTRDSLTVTLEGCQKGGYWAARHPSKEVFLYFVLYENILYI